MKIDSKKHEILVKTFNQKKVSAWIFDLDGTLINSEWIAEQVLDQFFKEKGLLLSESLKHSITGRRWEDALNLIMQSLGVKLDVPHEVRLLSRLYLKARSPIQWIPGALEWIRSQNIPMAIVSGSTREEIQGVIDEGRLKAFIPQFWGAEDVSRGKPDPEGYLKAIDALEVDPKEVVIFEDSIPGVQSAQKTGATVLGVESSSVDPQDLTVPVVLSDFNEWMAFWNDYHP
ncbi:MAG: hypothetical protein CL678_07315 [Bdellovibrionaceae bacterium]|nr:hypothetical protein [Pseudobdellovibrionaceae bacterium]|tara:strand:+ start:7217 stop:7906 length:690 start_codon:yes stop_codon:yes gene_type:complete